MDAWTPDWLLPALLDVPRGERCRSSPEAALSAYLMLQCRFATSLPAAVGPDAEAGVVDELDRYTTDVSCTMVDLGTSLGASSRSTRRAVALLERVGAVRLLGADRYRIYFGTGPRAGDAAGTPQPKPPAPARSVVVYFIQQGSSGYIKIGQSSDPRRRLRQLQTSIPDELHLLGQLSGISEAGLHRRFASSRVRGEWFEPARELLAFINAHAEPVA